MPRWRLTLEYNGAAYCGWQRQHGVVTIQSELERVLSQIYGGLPIAAVAAGRTDSGVHALGQVVSFAADPPRDPEKLRLGCNTLLPKDISVTSAQIVPDAFNPRRGAINKLYRYILWTRPDRSPFYVQRAYHARKPLDWGAIEAGLALLKGTHNFRAFCGPGCEQRNPLRTISRAEHLRDGFEHRIEFEGPGFLKYQVRIMVGTLLECGEGKRAPESIPPLFELQDRRLAGRTALPDGLYMVRVDYPPDDVLFPTLEALSAGKGGEEAEEEED